MTTATYDPESRAFYVRWCDDPIDRTEQWEPDFIADLAADGHLIGIEILGVDLVQGGVDPERREGSGG